MLLPLAKRELAVALRRRGARERWVMASWLAGGITIICLCLGLLDHPGMGRALFSGLFALQCFLVVTRGLSLTADLFSEERRNGTLGLLVLAGLQPVEIFANKLLGAVLLTAYTVLGVLPFLAISFLAGGVPIMQFVCALVALANVLLFCVAIGLLASVVHHEGGQAQMAAILAVTISCAAVPLAVWGGTRAVGAGFLSEGWLVLSPAYAPYVVWRGFTSGSFQHFWIGSGITLACSLTALVLAATALHRTWRDGPHELALKPCRWQWRIWPRVSEAWRQQLRARVLDEQPFCWLAARDRRLVHMSQFFIVGLALLWLTGWFLLGRSGLVIALSIISSILLHQGLNWFLAYSAAKPLAEERQTGGLEILLTTPFAVEDIIAGQQQALTLKFKRVLIAASALDVLFLCGGLVSRHWSVVGAIFYIGTWLAWMAGASAAHRVTTAMAMWIASWTGRPAYAALQAMRPVIMLMLTLTPVKSVEVLAAKLARELRQIACAPIPARGTKRFAGWNPVEIFPPGRWGELELRAAKLETPALRHARLYPARRSKKRLQFPHQLRERLQ